MSRPRLVQPRGFRPQPPSPNGMHQVSGPASLQPNLYHFYIVYNWSGRGQSGIRSVGINVEQPPTEAAHIANLAGQLARKMEEENPISALDPNAPLIADRSYHVVITNFVCMHARHVPQESIDAQAEAQAPVTPEAEGSGPADGEPGGSEPEEGGEEGEE